MRTHRRNGRRPCGASLPLSKPALAVVALHLYECRNDYLGPLIYVNVESEWVLAIGVAKCGRAIEVGNAQLAYLSDGSEYHY